MTENSEEPVYDDPTPPHLFMRRNEALLPVEE
jgi:hypothetical protein